MRLAEKEWLTAKKACIWLVIVLITGFALRVAVICDYAVGPNMFSDDNGYMATGITFTNHGYVGCDSVPEQNTSIGPGMPLLLGGLFWLFGYDANGLLMSHIAFASIGLITAIGAYLLGTLLHSRFTGLLAALFCALEPGLVAVNTLFLTETPYMCLNVFVMYCFIRCAKEWHFGIYWAGVLCLVFGSFFKGLILMAPFAAVPVALRYRSSLKKWIPRIAIAALAFVIGFTPWWIRNYQIVGRFVPFTANRGDLQLLGSYMGWGYPEGDYDEAVMQLNIEAWEQGYQNEMAQRFARRGDVGKERLAEWFETNPVGFILTHLIYKPFVLTTGHLMDVDFVSVRYSQWLWWAALVVALWGLLCPRFGRKVSLEYYMPALYLLVATFITAIYAPLSRYGIPHFPFWLLYTAAGAADLLQRAGALLKKKKVS